MSKRSLKDFFSPPGKRAKSSPPPTNGTSHLPGDSSQSAAKDLHLTKSEVTTYSTHPAYPFPIANLPTSLSSELELLATAEGKSLNHLPDLDCIYYNPLFSPSLSKALFNHVRSTLPFYRVRYTITKFGSPTIINTPRYTTVFGIDETSIFSPTPSNPSQILTSSTTNPLSTTPTPSSTSSPTQPGQPIPKTKYKNTPRPIPESLNLLRHLTEALTGATFNFCLVNYYATGDDSISFHSDDEWFLGKDPTIASFTLGARRDFILKHKPPKKPTSNHPQQQETGDAEGRNEIKDQPTLKLSLGPGDMLLMRGPTQPNWLHSIPKRKGKASANEANQGRINITLRKAMVPAGTENYYRYNVGEGPVHRWDERGKEMREWKG